MNLCYHVISKKIHNILSENNKVQTILKQVQRDALKEKKDILNASADKEDCILKLNEKIDDIITDIVAQDDFIKNVPDHEVKRVSDSLKPLFQKAFVNTFFCLFNDIKSDDIVITECM